MRQFLLPVAVLVLFSTGISESVSAQGTSCSDPVDIAGIGADWPWNPNSASGLPLQGCQMGIGAADSWYRWTAEEAGDYTFLTYYAPSYAHVELYRGSDCMATYVGCADVEHFQSDAILEVAGVQAGEQFLLRGVELTGLLQVTSGEFDCPLEDTDAFANNQLCTDPAVIGNGYYPDIHVGEEPSFFSFCIADGASFRASIVSPHFYGFHTLHLRPVNGLPCDGNPGANTLAFNLGLSPSLFYANSTGADVQVVLEVGLSDLSCSRFDLDIIGANGCGGLSTASAFCDPMDLNSAFLSTQLNATPGTGVASGVRLRATQGPPGQFASMLVGTAVADPGTIVGQGRLCLASTSGELIGRYNVGGTAMNSIGRFNSEGDLENLVGTSLSGLGFDVPTLLPFPNQNITAGQTWHFQLWHREPQGQSNFSNGVSVTFSTLP